MIFLIFWLAGLSIGSLVVIFGGGGQTLESASRTLFFYQVVVTVSLTGLFGFIGHVLRSNQTAESIGWPKGSMFQKELGLAELGWGIAGILGVWLPLLFSAAIAIVVVPLFIGAGIIHIGETRISKNFEPGNVGAILPDFLIPFTLIATGVLGRIWT